MNRDTIQRTMLFDFFGELLTERQKEYYDLHYNEDLSLAEIAEQNAVSRQCVWDTIRRAEDSLREIEEKTGLVTRFMEMKSIITKLEQKVCELSAISGDSGSLLCEEISAGLTELGKE